MGLSSATVNVVGASYDASYFRLTKSSSVKMPFKDSEYMNTWLLLCVIKSRRYS